MASEFQPLCNIKYWSQGLSVSNLDLTVFEGEDEALCASGKWARSHAGPALNLATTRTILLPCKLPGVAKAHTTYVDARLMDAEYLDRQGKPVSRPEEADIVVSNVFIDNFSTELLHVFLLHSEGANVMPGKTQMSEITVMEDSKPHEPERFEGGDEQVLDIQNVLDIPELGQAADELLKEK